MEEPTKVQGGVPAGLAIVKAQPSDIPTITRIVNAAYTKYIPRIGKPPAPMTTDWAATLKTHNVWVLRTTADSADSEVGADRLVGAIVLHEDVDANSVKLNNLVVDPDIQGKGYGKVLMRFAEDTAREVGRPALTLFTNVLMYENLTLYPKMGFRETERRSEDGYDRVFYRKDLE